VFLLLVASLYTALHSIENEVCINCRAHFQKYAPVGLALSSTAGAVIVSPSSKPKFSLLHSSNSPISSAPSNRVSLWHRVFKGHRTTSPHSPSRPTDSVTSDITGGSGVSQFRNVVASDFIQPNRSVSVSSESTQLSVAQHPISLPETTSPKNIPNQLEWWSVDFNSNVKRAPNVKLEHVLTPGDKVFCVRFSPDRKYLAVGVNNGRTYIYDAKTGAKSWSVTFILVWGTSIDFLDSLLADNYETEKRGIWSLCFSPDGKYLAVSALGGQLRVPFLLFK